MSLHKIEGYALVTKSKEYLCFEQIGDRDVQVYTVEIPNETGLFETIKEVQEAKNKIITNTGIWNYIIDKEDYPVKIVRVIQLIDIEVVEYLNE